MKRLLAIILTAVLAACSTTEKLVYVPQTEYVIRTAPALLKQLPKQPAPIDVATADQVVLAQWIAANEGYMMGLEDLIKALIAYYEAPLKPEEKAGKKPADKPKDK
jgi:hypothetical protein